MLIGLISDSHDNLPRLVRAVEIMDQRKVELVLHAGDYVAPFTAKALCSLTCRWQGVLGNNDGEREGLAAISEGRIGERCLKLTEDGRKIVVIHDLAGLNQEEESDIVVYGHTHKVAVAQEAGRLLVNPGECCGWLTTKSTVAILDKQAMAVDVVEL
jgi:putative phosphoesterase